MAKKETPDLTPAALGRLVAGMTTKEVEAIIGSYLRPNLYQGRRFYSWAVKGAMLRAFFDGPEGTLSKAVLDTAEEHRMLELRGSIRRRINNCTVYRIWYCVSCRKRYRRSVVPAFICPICDKACEYISPGIEVPSTRRSKVWDEFWAQWKAETSLLEEYSRGELRENVKLKIFGLRLKAQIPAMPKRSKTKKPS